jgi:hypothetical protein
MTVDDALDRMELVGHDFYLFVDAETDRPSVVYRRKGWDYGVIGLDTSRSFGGRGGRPQRHGASTVCTGVSSPARASDALPLVFRPRAGDKTPARGRLLRETSGCRARLCVGRQRVGS